MGSTTKNIAAQVVTEGIPGAFSAIVAHFVMESIRHMIPWLIVTCAVILCDLVAGIRTSLLMREEVRFSRAVRRTMGKLVTYFSFVVMVCMINVACGDKYPIEVYSCLFVCFIEACSIIGNILRPKGIDFNIIKAIGLFGRKVIKIEKEDIEEILGDEKEK